MKQRLAPGAELDLVTAGEIEDLVREVLDHALQANDYETVRTFSSGKTDAGGNLLVDIFDVPPGYEFSLNRLLVDCDTATPGVPVTVPAAGYIDIRNGDKRVDFIKISSGLPALATDGGESAIVWRNGEIVQVAVVNGPASIGFTIRVQGRLRRLRG